MTLVLESGDVKIHRIVEQEAPFIDAFEFFPSLTPEMLREYSRWLKPRFISDDNLVVLCVQSYVIDTPHHTIMVDTCVGNHKPRPRRAFWNMLASKRYEQNLAAAGFAVEDIDAVMCTHLHVDHTGWNTRLENGRWVPTFPNASYLFSDKELQHWTERHNIDPASCPWMEDSVLPIVALDRHRIVKSSHVFNDHVSLIPTPGHTPDHFSVEVGKAQADAFITGDMVHSLLQVRFPEVGMLADFDSKQAGRTRREIFNRFADTSTRICTAHFPSPSTGRLIRRGDSFDFVEDRA